MTSKFNKMGQIIDRIRNPIAYAIRAAIKPWTVHDDLKPRPIPHRDDIAERFLGPHAYENDGWVRDGLK